jgi:hypothetical protein
MTRWPPGAAAVLAKLDHHQRSRAELIVLAGIDDRDWLVAIRFLVRQGYALQSGARRGTRYRRTEVPKPKAASSSPHFHVPSVVREAHHGLLEEVLRELDGSASSPPSSAPANAGRSRRNQAELRFDGQSGCDLIESMLRGRGVEGIIDHRNRGGCLWIIEAPGVREACAFVTATLGVNFRRKPKGARATRGQPAWWTSDMRAG